MSVQTSDVPHLAPPRLSRYYTADRITFNVIAYLLVGLFALACFLPFYLVVVASFTSEAEVMKYGYGLMFRSFSLEGYLLSLKNPTLIARAYGNTIAVTVIGTACATFLATMTGYVLQRVDFPWRNQFSFFFFFTTLFNGGLVPWYLLCTRVFGFKNHFWALILPGMFSVWNMIIAKNFMKSIPHEINESAIIDGAGNFTIYFKLILPLAKPLLATLTLFTALGYWNDWYNCMLFMTKQEKWTLQYYLQKLINDAQQLRAIADKSGIEVPYIPINAMKMSLTVIVTGPIILLYPFLQKHFVKGLTIGAVKG